MIFTFFQFLVIFSSHHCLYKYESIFRYESFFYKKADILNQSKHERTLFLHWNLLFYLPPDELGHQKVLDRKGRVLKLDDGQHDYKASLFFHFLLQLLPLLFHASVDLNILKWLFDHLVKFYTLYVILFLCWCSEKAHCLTRYDASAWSTLVLK